MRLLLLVVLLPVVAAVEDPAGDQEGAPLFADRDLASFTLDWSNGTEGRPEGLHGSARMHPTPMGSGLEHGFAMHATLAGEPVTVVEAVTTLSLPPGHDVVLSPERLSPEDCVYEDVWFETWAETPNGRLGEDRVPDEGGLVFDACAHVPPAAKADAGSVVAGASTGPGPSTANGSGGMPTSGGTDTPIGVAVPLLALLFAIRRQQ